jgi:hypothetical protein
MVDTAKVFLWGGFLQMKRAMLVWLFVLVCVALCVSGSVAQTLLNPGFENWSGTNTADNWNSYTVSGTIACYKGSTFTGTPAVSAHGGTGFQRVKLQSASSVPSEGGVYQRFASTNGASYTVTAYLLTRLTTTTSVEARLGLDPTGATTPGSNTVWSSAVVDDSSWTAKTLSVTAAGSYVTIFLSGKHANADTTQCNVFFDDVTIQNCTAPAAPSNVGANPGYLTSGNSSTLSATVESGCTVDWYSGSCSGTFVGSGTSLVVWPTATTTYYPRARKISGDCVSVSCGPSVTVTLTAHPVVTITPSNMAEYGWKMATSNGGTGTFTVGGGPLASEYAGNPTWPMGRGGFYATCDEISGLGDTPSTVWLGLDKLYVSPGVFKSLELIRLDQIKKLVYKTYVPRIPLFFVFKTYLNYARQPIRVAIATAKNQPPGYLNRRWYVNMPWPNDINVFNNQNNNYGHWDTNSAAPYDGSTAGWYSAGLHLKWDQWEALAADRGGEVLVPTSTWWDGSWPKDPLGWKSAGYVYDAANPANSTNPPGAEQSTGTGTAINFWVGARDDVADLAAWYNEPSTPWWKESFGFRGCLDEVTIGVQFDDIGYVETTYNLEPDPEAPDLKTVAMSQEDCVLPNGNGTWRLNPILQGSLFKTGAVRAKVCGRVLACNPDSTYGVYIDILDGSAPIDTDNYDPPYPANPEEYEKELRPQGLNLWYRPLPVRVHLPHVDYPPAVGEYWSVTGYPATLMWDHPIPDPLHNVTEVCPQLYIYSTIENCQRIAFP